MLSKRSLVCSVVALALFLPVWSSMAGLHMHGSSSAWNGGLAQTSLSASFLGSGDYIPINRLLDSRDWVTVTGNNPVAVNEMNAQGFPSNNTNLAAVNGWLTFFSFPSQTQRAGNDIFDWTGPGSTTWDPGATSIVSISGAGCTISGTTVSGTTCAATLDYTGKTGATLKITAVAGGGPTQARFYHVNDTAAIVAGRVCKGGADSKFYQTVGANFGVIRDLNWSLANFSNVAVWADRTPTTWFSYGANNYFPQSLITTNSPVNTSGAQYTLAFGGFTLTDKAHVIFNPGTITPPSYTSAQTVSSGTTLTLTSAIGIVAGMGAGDFNSQNALQPTARVASVAGNIVTFTTNPFRGTVSTGDTIYFTPMFSVNGTTSVPVVGNNGTPLGTANADNVIHPHWSTLTYDAALGAFLIQNSSVANSGLQGAAPPEAFTACVNEIGAHPWYVEPAYALDPPTDYVLQQATYAKNNLKPGLIPRFEGCNEDWNYSSFICTTYSDNKEFLRTSVNGDHDNWYGRAISQLGQTVSSVFGANRAAYRVEACMSTQSLPVAYAITAGTYNSGTGAVSLTTATSTYSSAQSVLVRGVTGTGSVASVNGSFTSTAGTNGTTLNYTIATGLTLTITPGSTAYTEYQGLQGNKLISPEYVSNGGSAAYNWVTEICPTAYYESEYHGGSVSELGWAYWYTHGASGPQQTTLVHNFLLGTMTTGFAGNLYWLQNTIFPGFALYLTTYAGTATIGYTGYEGGYGSNAGADYTGGTPSAAVTSVSLGATTTLTVGANAWNYICNTAGLCTAGNPKTTLTFGGGCALNATDPAVLSATTTTITVNVNSTGFTGCTTGTAVYDGAGGFGGWVQLFELGVKQNIDPTNLYQYELSYLQSAYSNGVRFPAEFDDSDGGDWGKYNPDVYQTNTPVISAVQAFQIAP